MGGIDTRECLPYGLWRPAFACGVCTKFGLVLSRLTFLALCLPAHRGRIHGLRAIDKTLQRRSLAEEAAERFGTGLRPIDDLAAFSGR